MSLPDFEKTTHVLRRAALCGLVASMALVSACTVRPLYSIAPLTVGSTVSAELLRLSSRSLPPALHGTVNGSGSELELNDS